MAERPKHCFLTIEIPSLYVDDIEDLREYAAPEATDSEHILNCIGEPSGCKLTFEVSGEKGSDVVTVWGCVDSAEVRAASVRYGMGGHLTEEQISEQYSDRFDGAPEEALDEAVDRLREAGVSDADIADDLRYQLARVQPHPKPDQGDDDCEGCGGEMGCEECRDE